MLYVTIFSQNFINIFRNKIRLEGLKLNLGLFKDGMDNISPSLSVAVSLTLASLVELELEAILEQFLWSVSLQYIP